MAPVDTASLANMKFPQINGNRLWSNIMRTSRFGGLDHPAGAMHRLALSDADKQVRDWFMEQAEDLGCCVKVDAAGNIFAVWKGNGWQVTHPELAPIGMGSHLDTQPLGLVPCSSF
jgi:N-carbamoyl-L-amino-acid hydrolase